MSRLDDYRTALLAAHEDVSTDELVASLDAHDSKFPSFIIDHGLGPLWHERTARTEFHASRMAAEALFLVQQRALSEVGSALEEAGIDYVAIKGAANRVQIYPNPALRACLDLDILVRTEDKLPAARAITRAGYAPLPEARNISRVIVMAGHGVDIDLHWSLLREGRLRRDLTKDMLDHRQRVADTWVLSAEHTLFALLVHPAFAKHLEGYEMGMHRVADLLAWLRTHDVDWPEVRRMLEETGVKTAAWATLRWVQLLAGKHAPQQLNEMLADLRPGALKRHWLDCWLKNNWSQRLSGLQRARLLGFSSMLHDTPRDALRAYQGRRRAAQRSGEDLAELAGLLGE